ncbi:gamma-glutamyltransferase family protein [Thalassorhabdus alkalitolerans]|uniref:Gamma-glutamyltransferase family protein n=1 Tax=Thalassorhabdus alkalitolerans TaxID=2282697 RepID=A0ABW0YSF5_9BACI
MSAKTITNILAGVVVLGLIIYAVGGFTGGDDDDQASDDEPATTDEANDDLTSDEVEMDAEEEELQEVSIESPGGYGISSSDPHAAEVGSTILEQGGNAADAVIAMSFTLGVTENQGSGLGGGGASLVLEDGNVPVFYDYRETAASTDPEDMIAVPGFARGMQELYDNHASGNFTIEELIDPAIQFAEEGYVMDDLQALGLERADYRISADMAPPLFPNGTPAVEGTTIIQPELAETMRTLQNNGLNDFYEGEIAQSITEQVDHLSSADLQGYEVETREPVHGNFENYDLYSAPPPLSGITFIHILEMAERIGIEELMEDEPNSEYVHVLSEIIREADFQRMEFMGDPNFYPEEGYEHWNSNHNPMHQDRLLSNDYLDYMVETRLPNRDRFEEVRPSVIDEASESSDTTHISVVDADGMAISTTHSLGNFFGSGMMVDGMLMNSQLTSGFNTTEGSPNVIEEGKRPRSFISPTIVVEENSEEIIVMGSPGGNRIPAMMAQTMLRHAYLDETYAESVNASRFFAEYDPETEEDRVILESPLHEIPGLRADLEEIGYLTTVTSSRTAFGSLETIYVNSLENKVQGISDSRRAGSAIVDEVE